MTDHTHHLFVVGGVGVAQWPVGAAEVGQLEGVVAVDAEKENDPGLFDSDTAFGWPFWRAAVAFRAKTSLLADTW